MIEQHCSLKDTFEERDITVTSSLVMAMLSTLYQKRKKGWRAFLKGMEHSEWEGIVPHDQSKIIEENILFDFEKKSYSAPSEEALVEVNEEFVTEVKTLLDIDAMRSDPIALINEVSRVLSNRFGFAMVDGQRNTSIMVRVLIVCQDNVEFVEQQFDVWVGNESVVPTNQALFTLLAVYLSNYRYNDDIIPRGFVVKRAKAIIEAMKKGGMYREYSVLQLLQRNMKGVVRSKGDLMDLVIEDLESKTADY
jgi:hypothetical protein